MCSGTQAAELGLAGQGVIAPGALADLVVLDRQLEVVDDLRRRRAGLGSRCSGAAGMNAREPPSCAGRLDQ